jgi:xylulokinase
LSEQGKIKSSSELILAIDIGTSSLKILFISLSGAIFGTCEVEIATEYGKNGQAYQDANDYLKNLRQALSLNQHLLEHVIAIGVTGHTPSLLPVDSEGRPTFSVMTWQDNQAVEEAAQLEASFGNPLSLIGTSLPWSPSACPAKMKWISNNHPGVVNKTRWLLQPKDFLGFHLTGAAVSDPWSTKGICNVLTLQPVVEIFAKTGWSHSVMPELRPGGSDRGFLSKAAADLFGFPKSGIPVSTGWSDAMSGMLGIGVFQSAKAFILTGTSAIVGISTLSAPMDGNSLYVIPQTCAPMQVLYGPTQSSGAALDWFGKLHNLSPDELIESAMMSTTGQPPIFLPYLRGERAPIWRSDVRGSFFGLDSEHTCDDLARAVLEGISLGERHSLEVARSTLGISIDEILLGGNAGKDSRWISFRLRTLGKNLIRIEDEYPTNRGTAMLALTTLGFQLDESLNMLKANQVIERPTNFEVRLSDINYKNYLLASKLTTEFADSVSALTFKN